MLRVTCHFLVLKSPAALWSHKHYTGNRTESTNCLLRYFVSHYFIVLATWASVFLFFKPIILQLQHFTVPPCSPLCLYKLTKCNARHHLNNFPVELVTLPILPHNTAQDRFHYAIDIFDLVDRLWSEISDIPEYEALSIDNNEITGVQQLAKFPSPVKLYINKKTVGRLLTVVLRCGSRVQRAVVGVHSQGRKMDYDDRCTVRLWVCYCSYVTEYRTVQGNSYTNVCLRGVKQSWRWCFIILYYIYTLQQSAFVCYFITDGSLFFDFVYPEQAGSAFLLNVCN